VRNLEETGIQQGESSSVINRSKITSIQNDEGQVVVRVHGELNTDIFAKVLMGAKQKTKDN